MAKKKAAKSTGPSKTLGDLARRVSRIEQDLGVRGAVVRPQMIYLILQRKRLAYSPDAILHLCVQLGTDGDSPLVEICGGKRLVEAAPGDDVKFEREDYEVTEMRLRQWT